MYLIAVAIQHILPKISLFREAAKAGDFEIVLGYRGVRDVLKILAYIQRKERAQNFTKFLFQNRKSARDTPHTTQHTTHTPHHTSHNTQHTP